MNLPGFTAEQSLSAASAYQNGPTRDTGLDNSVVPATCGQDYEGPCIRGWRWVCVRGSYPHREPCD